jgi:pectinesterase
MEQNQNNILKYNTFFLAILLSLSHVFSLTPHYSAIVNSRYSGEPGILVEGIPTFKTIREALHTVPEINENPFTIYIREGSYYEKLSIDRAHVHFIGENRSRTVISYDNSGDSPGPAGGICGTRGSYTLRIAAPDFQAENLTIENSFDYPDNALKADNDPAKVHNPQAVALMTTAESDRTILRNCTIRGYQDTLFPDAGRHYLYHCHILGHVDFIFGAGQAVFDNCDIISRNREGKNPTGYVTAPSTSIVFPFGFLFIDSHLLKESPDIPAGSVRLGRPWHPNADLKVSGSTVFISCYMDDHIGAEGYAPISSRDSSGQKIWFELKADSRFFEYGSYGPGAKSSPSRPTLEERAVSWYTIEHVLNGWIPGPE